jgi:hypothetical protein
MDMEPEKILMYIEALKRTVDYLESKVDCWYCQNSGHLDMFMIAGGDVICPNCGETVQPPKSFYKTVDEKEPQPRIVNLDK